VPEFRIVFGQQSAAPPVREAQSESWRQMPPQLDAQQTLPDGVVVRLPLLHISFATVATKSTFCVLETLETWKSTNPFPLQKSSSFETTAFGPERFRE
jgi:hypothetical protein